MNPIRDGFDAEVLLCVGHEWAEEDRTPTGVAPHPRYVCHVCELCRAIRCDSGFGPFRCLEARHHVLLPHRLSDGTKWPVGMDPGDSTEGGRWHL